MKVTMCVCVCFICVSVCASGVSAVMCESVSTSQTVSGA